MPTGNVFLGCVQQGGDLIFKSVKRFFFFLLCSIYLQAMAHHSWTEYDQTNLVKFSGAVT